MIRERENEDMQVTEQEFRRACDSVVAFTDQHEHLTNQQQRLLFTVVQSLANTLGASMKPRDPLPTFP